MNDENAHNAVSPDTEPFDPAFDPSEYEPYVPAENPDGLIRELRIPADMVVDMSKPKIIAAKPDVKESALRVLCNLSWLLLIIASLCTLRAMPRATNEFWFILTKAERPDMPAWDQTLLLTALGIFCADILISAAALPLLYRVRKHTAPRLVLLSTTALLSLLIAFYVLNILS